MLCCLLLKWFLCRNDSCLLLEYLNSGIMYSLKLTDTVTNTKTHYCTSSASNELCLLIQQVGFNIL